MCFVDDQTLQGERMSQPKTNANQGLNDNVPIEAERKLKLWSAIENDG